MTTPVTILLFSLGIAGYGWTQDDLLAMDLGVLMAVAALLLAAAGWRRRNIAQPQPSADRRRPSRPRRVRAWAVVDGSNVLFWRGQPADLENVRAVVGAVRARGREPLVWFDANAGYRIADRYLREDELADMLNLPPQQVRVAPKGTPADPLILESATTLSAPVVSNDRYRDWQEQFPLTRDPRRLIRGHMTAGTARLERLSRVAA